METKLTAEDAKQSLNAHVASKGDDLRAKYGPRIGWKELQSLLEDRSFVRYPCEIVFDAAPLLPDEFAHPVGKGERPEAGYTIYVHPFFMKSLDRVPYLVLYQLVLVNYGDFASADDAEIFGSNALGLAKDAYFQTVCEMAAEIEQLDAPRGDVKCGSCHPGAPPNEAV